MLLPERSMPTMLTPVLVRSWSSAIILPATQEVGSIVTVSSSASRSIGGNGVTGASFL